jgi:chorismate dehydratase
VSYLNAKPLIDGLEHEARVDLHLEVPSALLDGLRDGRFGTALLPVIDYQRMDGLVIVPAGGIGSDGETLTVRIFSRCPVQEMQVLACDPDSHTSVALARIVLAERFGVRPRFVDLSEGISDDPRQGMLLIGDKVVCQEPSNYPHQVDLGEAWKQQTGLPFVFAVWMAHSGQDLPALYETLDRARRRGMANIDALVAEHAVPRGWPPELARRYLTQHLVFDIGPRQLEAITLFHRLAFQHRILPSPPRELSVFAP